MDCNPPGSSVHGILQARTLKWVAISSSRASSDPGIQTVSLMSPALAGRFFTTSATWEAPSITTLDFNYVLSAQFSPLNAGALKAGLPGSSLLSQGQDGP